MAHLRSGLAAATLAVSALLVLSGPAAAADAVELKISHYLPDKHGIHADFLAPWAADLEQRTNGAVKTSLHPGPSTFGNVAKQMDQVRAGVVDIAHGLAGIPRGRLPRTSIMDMPFLAESADAATRTLWDLYTSGAVAEDYKGVKVLALHCHNAGLFHTAGKTVHTPDDLKGQRLRTPSPALSAMVEALGGTPVGMPPAEVYENLQKGVLDGTIFTWDAAGAFKLNEVVKYHTDARAYVTCFFMVMNQAKYDALPEAVRAAIDETTGDALIPKFGPWWDKWDARGREDAKARGHEIITLSEAERAAWKERLAPMTDAWLAGLEKEGVADARAIYAQAQELVAKYEAK